MSAIAVEAGVKRQAFDVSFVPAREAINLGEKERPARLMPACL